MDEVPVPLRVVLSCDYSSDPEVLTQIERRFLVGGRPDLSGRLA
jgi:hypothetical protein